MAEVRVAELCLDGLHSHSVPAVIIVSTSGIFQDSVSLSSLACLQLPL